MLTLELATTQQHYEELLELAYHHVMGGIQQTLDLIQLTCEQFGSYFRTTGLVFRICRGKRLVGFCWVEERASILFVHGLIIKPEFQGQGMGAQALRLLQARYRDKVDLIQLSVHRSNPHAMEFYKRLDFTQVQYRKETGFYLLQKKVRRTPQHDASSHPGGSNCLPGLSPKDDTAPGRLIAFSLNFGMENFIG